MLSLLCSEWEEVGHIGLSHQQAKTFVFCSYSRVVRWFKFYLELKYLNDQFRILALI